MWLVLLKWCCFEKIIAGVSLFHGYLTSECSRLEVASWLKHEKKIKIFRMLEIFSLPQLYRESYECLLPPKTLSHRSRVNKFTISQQFGRFIENLHERHAIAKNVLRCLSEVKLKFIRMKFIVFVCAATYEILFMFIAEVIWKQTWINFRSVRHFYTFIESTFMMEKGKDSFLLLNLLPRVDAHLKQYKSILIC